MSSFFVELSLVMLLAIIVSFIFHKLKQPLLVGYIFTGILAGPLFFDILSSSEGYETFSHIGVALLLFIVGLHLNLKLIKEMGTTALLSGLSQIILTALAGFTVSVLLGFSYFVATLIGIGLSFSSTIIIVKLLSDRREIEKVHGKLAMGILIIQDLAAAIMLIVLASITNTQNSSSNLTLSLIKTFIIGIVALIGVLLFSKYILEKILDKIASSQEFLFTFVIAWCLGVASFFAYLGFSVEIGALLAGIALASSPYQHEISSRIKPLRDFFIIMFFILLGSQMIPASKVPNVLDYVGSPLIDYISIFTNNITQKIFYIIDIFSETFMPAIILSLIVIIIKPILTFIVLNILGFHKKVSFLTSINLAQISEFSIIMMLIAQNLNLVDSQITSMLTLVIIITIFTSTYFITHSQNIYLKFKDKLNFLEIRKSINNIEKEMKEDLDILVLGYNRIGFSLLNTITKMDSKYLIVDFDPNVIKKLDSKQIPCVYGDVQDSEFIDEFNLESVKVLISTITELEVSIGLIKQFRKRNKTATIILTAEQIDGALELYHEGADYVILPHILSGDYVANLIEKYNGNFDNLLKEKINHISKLKMQKETGLEHIQKKEK